MKIYEIIGKENNLLKIKGKIDYVIVHTQKKKIKFENL